MAEYISTASVGIMPITLSIFSSVLYRKKKYLQIEDLPSLSRSTGKLGELFRVWRSAFNGMFIRNSSYSIKGV